MKFLITLTLVLFASTSLFAQVHLGQESDRKSSDGKIVYPKEIENCEPCKKLWLANNSGTPFKCPEGKCGGSSATNSTGPKAKTMNVKGN